MTKEKISWKETLNLPQTTFPMKAQLNRKEPLILKTWQETEIYKKILKKRQKNKIYVLHDGPPYANGNIHLGHALNKILKDFIVKSKSMEGFYAPYVPGWDCHGLPIELKIDQKLGSKKKEMPITAVRDKCREYAEKYIDIQREEFKRLGVFGDWEDPYTTLNTEYEASIIGFLKSFVKSGNIIRKKRPVYWCTSCQTALAEAEVEYHNHESHSIYTKFLLRDVPGFLKRFNNKEIFVLIWTTTPWTIPANLAIAVHPDFDYALFDINGERFIAASKLVPVIADILNSNYQILEEFKGKELNGFNTIHPLYQRDSVIINTDYVILDQGTGCVHTAPGHGDDDYRAGLKYNLEIYSPVSASGHFDKTTGQYEGLHIFKANASVIADLNNADRLIHSDKITHSYPHCWRCKKPVIFRATEQWFISMDTAELRQNALQEIKKVSWLPSWGEERIFSMIENRPDWCISRQRDWGVPIPAFFCLDCGKPLLSTEVLDKTEKVFFESGSDSWYTRKIEDFLPENTVCQKCQGSRFEKGRDIIDVWFESGSSFSILENYKNHHFPADMYLEGGDQYRGWFHSSLLISVKIKNSSPYRTVITHGWVLDHQGKAMSKSLGNIIKPQDIINEKGAEILRLWVAMVNYRDDIKLGNEILSRVTESYRKIRNTWRFMISVLSDFNVAKDSVKNHELRETDLYILEKLQQVKEKILNSFKNFEFHVIYHTMSNFFTIDLSSFYLNFMKDILYCDAPNSKRRRAAQTVIFKLLRDTTLLMAPILSFTSEEIWPLIPDFKGKQDSVHLHLFPTIEREYVGQIDKKRWQSIVMLRDNVLKEIEEVRVHKLLKDSLETEVEIEVTDDKVFNLIKNSRELFKEILVVSDIIVKRSSTARIQVTRSSGEKCPRCWNWFTEDKSQKKYPELCSRCNQVAEEIKIEKNG